MTIIFDGKEFADRKEKVLKDTIKLSKLKPYLVSILIGNNKASLLYTNLKKKAAERIGIKFLIKTFPEDTSYEKIIEFIEKLNNDNKVNGIMVQLPLPEGLKKKQVKILNSISKEKDVDGLRTNSPYMPAVVRATKEILEFAVKDMPYFGKKAAVVGAKGNVGEKIVKMLNAKGYKVCECDKDTRDLYAKLTGVDLVVSATGVEHLIKGEIIKEGVTAIDIGAPVAEFDKTAYDRAGFITPVPGGVGPVTIACLLENLVEATQ